MKKLKIVITDDSNKDSLIAEIWCNDKIIVEINSEKGYLEVEFNDVKGLQLDLENLLTAINIAKDKLVN